MDRRDVLTISGSLALATTLAGCAGDSPGSDTDTDVEADSGMSSDLDLREANVVVVNLDAGAQNAIRQGSDRQSVTETECP
jgi:hypothetical protein